MWNVKAKVIPAIIWATGTISKSLRQYLSILQGKGKIKEIKNNHIGRCTQTAESANVKIQNIFHERNNITCSTDCKYRTAAALHTIDYCFFKYIIVNTLHKGDNKDNNNSVLFNRLLLTRRLNCPIVIYKEQKLILGPF